MAESSYGRRNKAGFEMNVEDWYIVKDDGKMYKVSIFPTQRKAAEAHGYSPTREEAKRKAGSQGVAEVAGDVNSKERYHFLFQLKDLQLQ